METKKYLAYPLKFYPIFKEKVWGGQDLKTCFRRTIPPRKKIGESWEVAWLGEDVSEIANGPYTGRLLSDLAGEFPTQLLGTDIVESFFGRFPLLFKLLDAHESISVQVHPPDSFGGSLENRTWGKTEMWHVLWAKPGSQVICGLKEWVTAESLAQYLAAGRLEECLEVLDVSEGDTIYIPAGRVHGTKGSMVLMEVHQNSDITYRLYDWNREFSGQKRRPLQIEEAFASIQFHDEEERIVSPIVTKETTVEERLLVTCDYFTVEKVNIPIFYQDACNGSKFMVYFVSEGQGRMFPCGMPQDSMTLNKGDFLLLPACLGDFEIQTDTGCEIIKTVVP